MKVLVLGASGMLGHRVAELLSDIAIPLTREEYEAGDSLQKYELTKTDWVINCIGVIPQKQPERDMLYRINADFPNRLANGTRARVLQIATDCVFDGKTGSYTESSPKNATDDYGKSKALGEHPSFMNLRTSIVGSELSGKKSLFEWLRNQPDNAKIKGYINHYWNGVTTDAFARVVRAVINQDMFFRGYHHLVPKGTIRKYELIRLMAERAGRQDLEIIPSIEKYCNRTLATNHPYLNEALWQAAGYYRQPTIPELINEMKVE